jgi:hypothetical protein
MKRFVLACLCLSACGAPTNGKWTMQQQAIVGGTQDTGHPAVASVDGLGLVTYCTGTLIAPKTLLTAGHCLPSGGIDAQVGFGNNELGVANTFLHPNYTGQGKPFDVGLFQLSSSPGIAPLPFARRALPQLVPGAPLVHVGYGATADGVSGLGTKREETSPITRLDVNFVYSGDAVHNTCNGDSGGPGLLAALPDGGEVEVSITSDGPSCTTEGWDVRVDEVANWIVSTASKWETQIPADPLPDAGEAAPPQNDAGTPGQGGPATATQPDAGASGRPSTGSATPQAGAGVATQGCTSAPGFDRTLLGLVVALAWLSLSTRRRRS